MTKSGIKVFYTNLKTINGINRNTLQLIEWFFYNRHQRVVLNGHFYSRHSLRAGLPQRSVLGPLFFLIYINDLALILNSEAKLFADDTSLFSIVNCVNNSSSTLNSDLLKIQDWSYQWKMSYNPDQTKEAKKVIFSRKKNATMHLPLLLWKIVPGGRTRISWLKKIDEKIVLTL